MLIKIAQWQVECDQDATRDVYKKLPIGCGCNCDQCRNFDAAVGQTFPQEFYDLTHLMGIDPTKPAELMHWCRETSGLYLTAGWFIFVGKIISGKDCHEHPDGTGTIEYQTFSTGVNVGLSKHTDLASELFANYTISQLEFETHVPWVLVGVEPAP